MAAAFQPAILARRRCSGYGGQARFLDSPQHLFQRLSLLRHPPLPRLRPLLFRSPPATVEAAAAADMTATTITTRRQRQLQLLFPRQHLRQSLQATAARRPRVATQILICPTAI